MHWRTVTYFVFIWFVLLSVDSSPAISQQDKQLSACGSLNPNEVSDLIQAIKCIKQLAKRLQLVECAALDADRKGDTIKAAICAGNFAESYITLEETVQEERANTTAEINALVSKAGTLEKRLAGVKVDAWHKFSIGEYDSGSRIRPRLYCGADVNAKAVELCGSKAQPFVFTVDVRSGHKCGYHDVVVACVSK